MLPRILAPVGPRRPLAALAGLLALAVLTAGMGLTSPAAPVPKKDETKKADSQKDATKKNDTSPDEIKKPSGPNPVPDPAQRYRENQARMLEQMRQNAGAGMPYSGFMDPRSAARLARGSRRPEPPWPISSICPRDRGWWCGMCYRTRRPPRPA